MTYFNLHLYSYNVSKRVTVAKHPFSGQKKFCAHAFLCRFLKEQGSESYFCKRAALCALCIVRELRGALSKSVHCLPPSCSGAITEKLMARGTALIDVFPLSVGGEGWGGVSVYCDGSC
jgi:hypothetical protein